MTKSDKFDEYINKWMELESNRRSLLCRIPLLGFFYGNSITNQQTRLTDEYEDFIENYQNA